MSQWKDQKFGKGFGNGKWSEQGTLAHQGQRGNAVAGGYRGAADNANGTAPRSENIFVGYLILEMPADSQSEKGKNYIPDMLHCVKLDSVVMPCTAVSFHVLTFNRLEPCRSWRLQPDKIQPVLLNEQPLFLFWGSGNQSRNSLLSIYRVRPMNMEHIFMLITVFPAKPKNCACGSEVGRELLTQRISSCKVKWHGGVGSGFLLNKTGCELWKFLPHIFLPHIFLRYILTAAFAATQHSSGREDHTWIDHVHPKVWC